MNRYLKKVIGLTCIMFSFSSQAQTANDTCISDLKYIPQFLLANDTGAKDHLKQYGTKHFDDALKQVINQAKTIEHAKDCFPLIKDYLKSWRHGHLAVAPLNNIRKEIEAEESQNQMDTEKKDLNPKLEVLSDKTLLLTLPTFDNAYKKTLEELIQQNHKKLASSENWIIDVRQNNGGSDSTYSSLLPWLMDLERVEVGVEWLVTPINTTNQQKVCELFAAEDKGCLKWSEKLVNLMKTVASGEYVSKKSAGLTYLAQKELKLKRPERVAILIDKPCGSSCEQFLLTVRQSFHVKLLGRRTYGSLDYSNLRPHALPSGNYELYYATSRSLRLPYLPVDVAGIIPDIYLPKPKNLEEEKQEVVRVKNWLEAGTFSMKSE